MSGTITRTMLTAYEALAGITLFFSGMFRSPMSNFYSTEEVEFDILRSGEDISIVVTDLSTGYRMNSGDLYTNKSFKPPVHKEAVPINSFDLLKRMPGANPFADKNFRADLVVRMMWNMRKIEDKIRRAMELQAAQVLQTGTITLIDSAGNSLYTVDFAPKATHFPTSSTAWGQTGADILGDLESLMDVIRDDGLEEPSIGVFGTDALDELFKDTTVLARLDNRNFAMGAIEAPTMNGAGGKYHGTLTVGRYKLQIWSYNGKYIHPQTLVRTPYMAPEKVVIKSENSRLDATFGAVPNIGQLLGVTGTSVLPEASGRFMSTSRGMDLFTNAWISPDGEQLFSGIAARPLMIPTAIDTFGCLDTGL